MEKDNRRFFTPAQRRALYWAANRRCEECGIELDPKNWHADHSHPHSLGGFTDVINGRALCPSCNLKKGAKMKSPFAELYLNPWPKQPPLRRWQDRFLERWLLLCDPNAGGQKDFLMAVVPAAGKTTASLKAAHEGLSRGWFGQIVIVVPSRQLVRQWIDDAGDKGISLKEVEDYGGGITRPADAGGIVTTYQSVAANPGRFRAYSSRTQTFVICDEIHHCGENENLSWGPALSEAFDHDQTIRLESSGTPFRTDKATIPFTKYDEQKIEREDGVVEIHKVARADFEYSYGEALRDGVVRDIFFPTWDGKLSWRRAGQEFTHTFQDDLDSQLASDRLRVALDPRGEWLSEVISNANERLMTIRSEEGHPNAGGLIICRDQAHAAAVAELVKKITGNEPAVAYSDLPDATEIIDKFKKGSNPWIVTVRMVSEGVDIKRLRVGIYATVYRTRLFFQQAIARTTRYDSTVAGLARDGQPVGQPAWFYVPDDPELQSFMSQIMEISIHHISDDFPVSSEDFAGETEISDTGQLSFLEGYEYIDGADAIETGHFYEERKWTPEEMDKAIKVFNGIPAFDHIPAAAKALAAERFLSQQEVSSRSPQREIAPEPSMTGTKKEPTYQAEREKLKYACSNQTRKLIYHLMQINQQPKDAQGRLVFEFGKAISIVTAKLNKRFNVKNIGDSTNQQLNERRDLLAEWIHDISQGSWDPSRLN